MNTPILHKSWTKTVRISDISFSTSKIWRNFIHQATKPSANSSADCKAVLPVEKEMICSWLPQNKTNCVTFIQYWHNRYTVYILKKMFLKVSLGMLSCFVLGIYFVYIYCIWSFSIQALGVFVKDLPGKLGEGDKAQAGEASKNNSQFAMFPKHSVNICFAICDIFAFWIFFLEKIGITRSFFWVPSPTGHFGTCQPPGQHRF